MKVDVAVVGAGIVGWSVARSLAREGHSVTVVDREARPHHASWAAAGMLAPQAESDEPDALLPLLLQARVGYPAYVNLLEKETGLQVGYSPAGMLLLAFDRAEEARLDHRAAWQLQLGLEVERLTGDRARSLEPSISSRVRSALRFRGDHSVDNRLLTEAVSQAARNAGAHLVTGEVVCIEAGEERLLELSDGRRIPAERIVLAAGSWSGGIQGLPRPLPVEPVHGQLIGYAAPGVLTYTVGSADGYLVPRADGRIIAGTTVARIGFDTDVTEEGMRAIRTGAETMIPALADREITAHWAGLRPGTPDGLPVLGPDPDYPALLYATGHFRNGILLGPLTGELIADLVAGRTPRADLTPFGISRFSAGLAAGMPATARGRPARGRENDHGTSR